MHTRWSAGIHDFTAVGWVGMGIAFTCYVAIAVVLCVTVVDDLTDAQARIVAGLTVIAVTATWASAAHAYTGALGAYQPMLSSSTVVAVILMLRGRSALAWTTILIRVVIGLVLGPLTGSGLWFNAVLPRASLTILFVATCAAVLLAPQIAEMRALGIRRRDANSGTDRTAGVGLADRGDRIRRIDARVRPLLTKVAEGGDLTVGDVAYARLTEARLRDGIRGRGLDVPRIRDAVWAARARGASVTLLDDGGLVDLSAERSSAVIESVADVVDAELADLSLGDVVVRIAPAGRDPVATVTIVSQTSRRRVEFGVDGFVLRTVRT
ncbi:hypothetical protein ACFOJ6_16655 [Gordonia humi]|uniref:hypothetical protein n=1 Tax=Gordonia humi TaxID=686429 RepID=UPI003612ADD0